MQLTIREAEISLQATFGVTLSRVGAAFPETLKKEQWEQIGESLYKLDSTVQWIIGDWWIHGGRRYGNGKDWAEKQQIKFKNAYTYETLTNIGSVCRTFKFSRRRENVSFEKHRELLGLSSEEQDKMLDRIEKGEFGNHKKIREAVAALKPARKYSPAPAKREPRKDIWQDKPKPLQLTREQVDPDFKGSNTEWVDKHGLVQVRTLAQKQIDDDQDAFSAWVRTIRELREPLERYLEVPLFKEDNFHAWVKKAKDPQRRLTEITELISLIRRTNESLQWLVSLSERKQTNGEIP